MQNIKLILVGMGLLLAAPTSAYAKVNIFACEPEWAALATEVGGEYIKVKSATHALQDPHYVRAKPSLLSSMRKADIVICSGADLEVGWLPILLQKAGRSQVQKGAIGHLMAAKHVSLLDKPKVVDRSHGDVHADGNPHLHLNPKNIELVAKELSKRLQAINPENSDSYKEKLNKFTAKWAQETEKWKEKADSLNGSQIISHHKSWAYLLGWLKINEAATLEAVPGQEPTVKHLQALIQTAKAEKPFAIIRSPYNKEDASVWLSEKTGIKQSEIPFTIYKEKGVNTLFDLYDTIIEELLRLQK